MIEIPGIIGGLVGLVGGLANGIVELFKFDKETKRLAQEWEHKRELAKINSDIATEVAAGSAFTASQSSALQEGPIVLPANATRGQAWLALITQSLRSATRPMLTWTLVGAALYNPDVMADPAAMAVGWWFGSRTTTRFFNK
jgi:hypothetical protein